MKPISCSSITLRKWVLGLVLAGPLGGLPASNLAAESPSLFQPSITVQLAPDQQLPEEPLIRPAPEFSRWTTVFFYKSDLESQTAEPRPLSGTVQRTRKSVTTKTGAIIREDILDDSGKIVQRWFSGKTQYFKEPGDPCWFETKGEVKDDIFYQPMPAHGFRGFEWIEKLSFVGFTSWQGRSCLVFIPGGISKGGAQSPPTKTSQIKAESYALVDAQTRLPLVLKKGDEVRKIEFMAPVQEMQVLPADLQGQITKAGAQARLKR